jgi:hypothetical protein
VTAVITHGAPLGADHARYGTSCLGFGEMRLPRQGVIALALDALDDV